MSIGKPALLGSGRIDAASNDTGGACVGGD
jgi:hypothetical protein